VKTQAITLHQEVRNQQQQQLQAALCGGATNPTELLQQMQQAQMSTLTSDLLIENMRTPNIFDMSAVSMQKTSKRILNQNAIKFKLTKLKTSIIRYEVIYKNLVRDLRKFYSQDFNKTRSKRFNKLDATNFSQSLEAYIKVTFSDLFEELNIPIGDLIFNLGSLIYPKLMLKLLKNNALVKVQVVSIYNYLYKFSLERLQHFLNNESLMLLFVSYLRVNRFRRIHESGNMVKYRHAYYEACNIMINQSRHKTSFARIFDLKTIFKVPTDTEFEHEHEHEPSLTLPLSKESRNYQHPNGHLHPKSKAGPTQS